MERANLTGFRLTGFIPVRLVANKMDLRSAEPGPDRALRVSALTGQGLDKLISETVKFALEAPPGVPYVQTRHVEPLTAAIDALSHGLRTASEKRPFDLLSVDLRTALSALGEITGETATEDMIERIFRDFCVGK